MIIDALFDVLPRPAAALEAGDDQGWLRVFQRLGTRLPEDFVQYIRGYGTGVINDYLAIYNPFAENPNLNLIEQLPYILSSFRTVRSEAPQDCPYPLYFEPNGLLPWGATDAESLFWETSGDADRWPVVIVRRNDPNHERHEMPMSRFLAEGLGGRLSSVIFPARNMPSGGPRFEPAIPVEQSP